jgi:hypothetical protein
MGFEMAGQDFVVFLPEGAGPYLILDRDLRIVAANPEYLRTTLICNQEIAGRGFFEIFPGNPQNPHTNGVQNLSASFRDVLRNGRPDRMEEQRYDIRDHVGGSGWLERYWVFENVPFSRASSRKISHLIHKAEDVTDGARLRQWISERMVGMEEQRATLEQMLQDLTNQYQVFGAARSVLAERRQPDSLIVEELRSALGAPLTRVYFRPGETVPASAIYNALHTGGCELTPNQIYCAAGGTFSRCPRCREAVYYRFVKSV